MPDSALCSKYVVLPSSGLTFEARSSSHPVHGKAAGLSGFVSAAWGDDGSLLAEPAPEMHVEFPVERLSSGNALQDREMWKLIDSRRFPRIAADLREIRPGGAPGRYAAAGDITLAGRSRRYQGELSLLLGDQLALDGDLTVDIRDFGLTPPRLLFIKVEPQVKVHLHLIASRQA